MDQVYEIQFIINFKEFIIFFIYLDSFMLITRLYSLFLILLFCSHHFR